MKKYETVKLFYDLYKYKLVLYNPVSPIFRDKKFHYTRKMLDTVIQKKSYGVETYSPYWMYKTITQSDIADLKFLYNEFTSRDYESFKLRVESNDLSIYSNDSDWLEKISKKIQHPREYWRPLTQLEQNTVMLKERIPFDFRVTTRRGIGSPAFAQYAKTHTDKIRIGDAALECHENQYRIDNLYFYVKNDKILTIIELMLPGLIRRVDKVKYR